MIDNTKKKGIINIKQRMVYKRGEGAIIEDETKNKSSEEAKYICQYYYNLSLINFILIFENRYVYSTDKIVDNFSDHLHISREPRHDLVNIINYKS